MANYFPPAYSPDLSDEANQVRKAKYEAEYQRKRKGTWIMLAIGELVCIVAILIIMLAG
jgi:hypothetical protein